MSAAPLLHTARLRLRPHRREDYAGLTALWTDPKVMRFIGAKISTPQECWFRLMRYMGMWSMLRFGYWAVCDPQSDIYLGEVGFSDFRRGLGDDFDGAPEAGWSLAPEAWGRGLATEAMDAAQGWMSDAFPGRRCVCMIDVGNTASIRVAEKLGYAPLRDTFFNGSPSRLFARVV